MTETIITPEIFKSELQQYCEDNKIQIPKTGKYYHQHIWGKIQVINVIPNERPDRHLSQIRFFVVYLTAEKKQVEQGFLGFIKDAYLIK